MIAERALAIAGPGAVLARRPRARVAHVYVGPLTPSGRYVPRTGRTVCRARTRRLSVLTQTGSSLEHSQAGPCLVCARCSARLLPSTRRAEQHLRRDDWLRTYAGTTKADVAFALQLAETPTEVDAAAHLSLLLFEVAGCNTDLTDASGRSWRSLHKQVARARGRVGGFPESRRLEGERHAALSADARDQRRRENQAARAEREERIERLGISIAEPTPRRPG